MLAEDENPELVQADSKDNVKQPSVFLRLFLTDMRLRNFSGIIQRSSRNGVAIRLMSFYV